MTGKFLAAVFYLIIFLTLTYNTVCAFDDQDTHPRITEKAVVDSNLDIYLSQNLGFTLGSRSLINGKSILKLLTDGSTAEDNPWCKASSHFHDPLKPWDQAGLSGYQGPLAVGIDGFCAATSPYTTKYSNVVWATSFTGPDGGTTTTINDMDWNDARTFYKDALTSASKTDRETNFAKTFQALGQVSHLIQDMAVPAIYPPAPCGRG